MDSLSNQYVYVKQIGHGGNATVYLARDQISGRPVAIKEFVEKSAFVQAFKEISLINSLDFPAIPKIYQVSEYLDRPTVVMDYLPGMTLESYVIYNEVNVVQIVQWMIEMCDILTYLHSRTPRIIYRDLKPANIIISPVGKVRLIDFGAAIEIPYKNNNTTKVEPVGTVGFAPPEQYGSGEEIDERTDLYALGVTMRQVIKTKLDKHNQMSYILNRCIQKEKNKRYRFAAEIKSDLISIQHGERRKQPHLTLNRSDIII